MAELHSFKRERHINVQLAFVETGGSCPFSNVLGLTVHRGLDVLRKVGRSGTRRTGNLSIPIFELRKGLFRDFLIPMQFTVVLLDILLHLAKYSSTAHSPHRHHHPHRRRAGVRNSKRSSPLYISAFSAHPDGGPTQDSPVFQTTRAAEPKRLKYYTFR